jgi:hypothetical protein
MDMQVANTIREQIGRRALFMLGAKELLGDETSLRFKIGRNAKSVSHIKVIYHAGLDTYEVQALRMRRPKGSPIPETKVLESTSDVYVDSLHTVIESLTGMHTSI